MPRNESLTLLLIEDDDVDAMAFGRHIKQSGLPATVHRAVDGVEALELIRGKLHPSAGPFLILLDLNMPRMSGEEFLCELREDPNLRLCVVFVLTTSDAMRDRISCYEKNVAGYMLKSEAGERFENVIALLDAYRTGVQFPPIGEYS